MKSLLKVNIIVSLILSLILFGLINNTKVLKRNSKAKETVTRAKVEYSDDFFEAQLITNYVEEATMIKFKSEDPDLSDLIHYSFFDKSSEKYTFIKKYNSDYSINFSDIKAANFISMAQMYIIEIKLRNNDVLKIILNTCPGDVILETFEIAAKIEQNFNDYFNSGNIVLPVDFYFRGANDRNIYLMIAKLKNDEEIIKQLNCQDGNWDHFTCKLPLEKIKAKSFWGNIKEKSKYYTITFRLENYQEKSINIMKNDSQIPDFLKFLGIPY